MPIDERTVASVPGGGSSMESPRRTTGRINEHAERSAIVEATTVHAVRSRLRHDLTLALKARDRVAIAALRSAIAAIENAEAIASEQSPSREASSEHVAGATAGAGSSDVARWELSDAEVDAIVPEQVDERLRAADRYEQLGRWDASVRLRQEAAVLRAYAPRTM